MRSPRTLTAAVLMGLAAALSTGAGAEPGVTGTADAVRVARPTEPGSPYAFEAKQVRRFAGRSVVVHYVTRTADAPKKLDADRDGTPDYVELVAEVAESALAFYAKPLLCQKERCADVGMRPFRRPLPDAAGPNGKPDIYLKSDLPGSGLAIENVRGAGGGFVLLDPRLDTAAGGSGTASTWFCRTSSSISWSSRTCLDERRPGSPRARRMPWPWTPRTPGTSHTGRGRGQATSPFSSSSRSGFGAPGSRSSATTTTVPAATGTSSGGDACSWRAQPPPAHLRGAGGAAARRRRRRHRRDQSGARGRRNPLQRAYFRRRPRGVLGRRLPESTRARNPCGRSASPPPSGSPGRPAHRRDVLRRPGSCQVLPRTSFPSPSRATPRECASSSRPTPAWSRGSRCS